MGIPSTINCSWKKTWNPRKTFLDLRFQIVESKRWALTEAYFGDFVLRGSVPHSLQGGHPILLGCILRLAASSRMFSSSASSTDRFKVFTRVFAFPIWRGMGQKQIFMMRLFHLFTIRFFMIEILKERIFTTALRNKKIPHFTSTAYCLLSYRLLWWKEPIWASCLFRGFQRT